MKRQSLSLVTLSALVVCSAIACKKDRGSGLKSQTEFSATDKPDLLTYTKDYTAEEFEAAYNELFSKNMVYEGYKCKVRQLKRFRDPSKPELAPFQKLDDTELVGIITYTGSAYTMINRPLRVIKGNQDRLVEDLGKPEAQRMTEMQRKSLQAEIDEAYRNIAPWRLIVKAAASGLNRLPEYHKPVIRGATLRDEFIKGYCEKECASADVTSCTPSTEAAFTSTTFNPTLGGFVGNVKFNIDATRGRAINAISEFPTEGEVLFAPGTDFAVTKVRFSDGMTCSKFLEEYAAKYGSGVPQPQAPSSGGLNGLMNSASGSGDGSDGSDAIDGTDDKEILGGIEYFNPNGSSTSTSTGISMSAFLTATDPTDCPGVATSVEGKSDKSLAQTSIGEAIMGTSPDPVGLSADVETSFALQGSGSILKANTTLEIDLKEIRR